MIDTLAFEVSQEERKHNKVTRKEEEADPMAEGGIKSTN